MSSGNNTQKGYFASNCTNLTREITSTLSGLTLKEAAATVSALVAASSIESSLPLSPRLENFWTEELNSQFQTLESMSTLEKELQSKTQERLPAG